MTMKEAFETYFEKLNKYSLEIFNTKPLAVYSEKINKELIVSEPDEEGYVEWQPIKSNKELDWERIEREYGFKICDELKAFYSTCYFCSLKGELQGMDIEFYSVGSIKNVEDTIKEAYIYGNEYFPSSKIFLIGRATIDEDDSYYLFFNNDTNELFCYESENNSEVSISHSISETIYSMEAQL